MLKDIHVYLLCLVLICPDTILPKMNTMRFKNSFIDRLVFKYELTM